MNISDEKVTKALIDNIDEVLKDVITGYDSPVKKMLTDEDSEFQKKLTSISEKVFLEVVESPEFREDLKEKFMQTAIEKMLRKD